VPLALPAQARREAWSSGDALRAAAPLTVLALDGASSLTRI
jgi:hypothetical protein